MRNFFLLLYLVYISIYYQIYDTTFDILSCIAYHTPFGYLNTNCFSFFVLKYNTWTVDKYWRHPSHAEKSPLH